MSYVAKDKDVDANAPAPQIHKIRITLTSKNVKNLEKGELKVSTEEKNRR
jgi:small subunit ribosomal protein S20e